METNGNDISAYAKRLREAHERQLLAQPPKPCGLCNWSMKYEHAKEQWGQKVTRLEREVAILRRRLRVRALDNRLKPRTDTYSLQSHR